MKTIFLSILLLASGYFIFTQSYFAEEDIYIDTLAYLKKDSSLFNGTLKVIDEDSYFYESYCDGIPCNSWSEHQNGGSYVPGGHL